MVLRGAFGQVGLGLVIGVPAAIAAGHFMAAELFGLTGVQPCGTGYGDSLLGCTALMAAVLPGEACGSIDPTQEMRAE